MDHHAVVLVGVGGVLVEVDLEVASDTLVLVEVELVPREFLLHLAVELNGKLAVASAAAVLDGQNELGLIAVFQNFGRSLHFKL